MRREKIILCSVGREYLSNHVAFEQSSESACDYLGKEVTRQKLQCSNGGAHLAYRRSSKKALVTRPG